MTDGRSVAQDFYEQAARPIIEGVLSGVGHLVGRLGSGSDVLGLDDDRSRDHDFGCRLTVLVDDPNQGSLAQLDAALDAGLPDDVAGWPTRFASSWDDRVRHKVDLHTVHDFAATRLGFDLRDDLQPAEWLCLTGQSILEVTGGPVFHDTTESFRRIADSLTWYPDDLWRYVLASGWSRLDQELPLVGRTGELGDEAESRIIAARTCRDLAHLTFLIERRWSPYPKWSGVALRQTSFGEQIAEALAAVQVAADWVGRQRALSDAIDLLAERHRTAGFELPEPTIQAFFDRPFPIPNAEIRTALLGPITDDRVRDLPPIGSIEQWSDNVDLLSHPQRRIRAVSLYRS